MASTSQRPEGRDGALPTLYVFIQALNIAKDTCGIPPAQTTFGSAAVLLTIIRARYPLFSNDELPTDVYLGHDVKRSGFRRPWEGLR
jgi:hypothetical protein